MRIVITAIFGRFFFRILFFRDIERLQVQVTLTSQFMGVNLEFFGHTCVQGCILTINI